MPASLQDTYLAEIRRQGVPVTVYLVNGFQLRGIVKGFDPFTILIEFERKTHLIYKHAVSAIPPQGPFAGPPPQVPPSDAAVETVPDNALRRRDQTARHVQPTSSFWISARLQSMT